MGSRFFACKSDQKEPPAEAPKPTEGDLTYMAPLDDLGLQMKVPKTVVLKRLSPGLYTIDDPALKVDVIGAENGHPTTIEDGKKSVREPKPVDLRAETLSDGWILTFQNKSEFAATWWLYMRRDIAGKGVLCRTTVMTSDQIVAAIDACKSLTP